MHGVGLLIYIILWIVVPEESFEMAYPINNEPLNQDQSGNTAPVNGPDAPAEIKKGKTGRVIAGTILIALGVIFFADRFIPSFDLGDIIPILFLLTGGLLIWNSFRK
jgi:hypothetical protein